LATRIGLLPGKSVTVRTVDTGGAGPVTGLLEAKRMVQMEGADLVAVVAGDAVKKLSSQDFLRRADQTCQNPESALPSPVIPSGYDRIAQYQMKKFGTSREQLAICSALMSIMASRHPDALTKTTRSLANVLDAVHVAPVTSVLECARRADGGAALLVASSQFLEKKSIPKDTGCVIVGGGEASGPLFPPRNVDDITEAMFSCEEAAAIAYEEAQMSVRDIDFFGLYDCFPICLIRAIEGFVIIT
jgi:acetyl-CoA acetyltransferase